MTLPYPGVHAQPETLNPATLDPKPPKPSTPPPPSPDIHSHLNLVSLNPKPELNSPTLDNHSSQVTQDSPKRLFLGPGHRGTRKPPLPASGLLANSMEFRV